MLELELELAIGLGLAIWLGHGQHDHRCHRVPCLKQRRGPPHCNPASDRWRHVSMQIVELELDLGLRQTLWLALGLALWLTLGLILVGLARTVAEIGPNATHVTA